ncbi:MAG: hypothetical protein KU37_07805 [Sulfuricurvum sp. PC08-66]|nr:MAG: hypothetical protein KU37_07805 [Sulfuricurvum sp. PC08-66]
MCNKRVDKIILGRYNCLEVARQKEHGLYLKSGDGSELLMPKRYVTPEMQIGSLVEAFVYTDSEDRMVATTETPLAQLGEFAYLECVDVSRFGAFIYWGLAKDLLVPRSAQLEPMQKGQKYLVRISFDNETHRLVGVTKTKPFIVTDTSRLTVYAKYPAIIEAKTPMGYKIIVNHQYQGILFKEEVFTPLSVGDSVEVYLKNIREDGKLDCTLQALGDAAHSFAQEKIMALLEAKKALPYTADSDPKLISETFGLSKKVFKRTLQELLAQGKIVLKPQGIYLP